MGSKLRIVNGKVYDPANGIDGQVRDICVEDGRIVESVGSDAKKIDAQGMVIMPGGVDIHCHIAGPKVNLARKLQPDDHRYDVHPRTAFTRSGTGGTVPSTFTTGYRYATLGYTTAMEAAVTPLGARHTLEELHDTPVIDKGFYILLGNNVLLNQLMKEGRRDELKQAVAWWLNATRAYTVKLVNPGGDEPWKGRRNSVITDLDATVESFDVTPRQIITSLIEIANNLGHSGNYKTTLETMRMAGDSRVHITHIQFHSYGGEPGKNPVSMAPEIAAYVNDHPNISADVGQVMFGKSTVMTADAPVAHLLRRLGKDKRWVNSDTECESGCGIIPFSYQERIYTHALQWAIGLELFLLTKDPWRMVLSTDHPNGGSFMSYPKLIRLLMDRNFRDAEIKRVNQRAIRKTTLADGLAREYTLNEIAIVTRAGPARLLGLKNKGHLGAGADADITIYEEDADKEKMFSAPRYVVKDGKLIIEDHEFRADHEGRILHVSPDYDPGIEKVIKPFFESYYSIRFENYAVAEHYMRHNEQIPTGKAMAAE